MPQDFSELEQELIERLKESPICNINSESSGFILRVTIKNFPESLDKVAQALKDQGIEERLVHMALLSLCGVPFRPVNISYQRF